MRYCTQYCALVPSETKERYKTSLRAVEKECSELNFVFAQAAQILRKVLSNRSICRIFSSGTDDSKSSDFFILSKQ